MSTVIDQNLPIKTFPKFITLKDEPSYFPNIQNLFIKYFEPLFGNQSSALLKIKEGQDRECEILIQGDKIIGLIVYKNTLIDNVKFGKSLIVKNLLINNFQENSQYELLLIDRIIQVAKEKLAKGFIAVVSQNSYISKQKDFSKLKWGIDKLGSVKYLVHKALC